MPKPNYDTTLARIAGNILGGFVREDGHEIEKAERAVRLARIIVRLCREQEKEP